MSKKKNYEDFPLSLALFDALPVLFFCSAMVVICCTLAGLGKVIWKIILAATRKDYAWMNRQMRFVMPVGFLLILIGIFTGGASLSVLKQLIFSIPAGIFFGITVMGMICMSIFACKLDGTKVRNNWIEQITNAIAKGCLLIGVLLCM